MDRLRETMILGNRKINRTDYNIFIQGLHTAFGTSYGNIEENIGKALRHYGTHLINGELEIVDQTDHTSRRKDPTAKKPTSTVIFGPETPPDPPPPIDYPIKKKNG